jgi:hypothetical protein
LAFLLQRVPLLHSCYFSVIFLGLHSVNERKHAIFVFFESCLFLLTFHPEEGEEKWRVMGG